MIKMLKLKNNNKPRTTSSSVNDLTMTNDLATNSASNSISHSNDKLDHEGLSIKQQ